MHLIFECHAESSFIDFVTKIPSIKMAATPGTKSFF